MLLVPAPRRRRTDARPGSRSARPSSRPARRRPRPRAATCCASRSTCSPPRSPSSTCAPRSPPRTGTRSAPSSTPSSPRRSQAQVGLDDAGRALEADRAAAARRVRALYRTGGTAELAWTALASTGSGFSDAASGFRAARVVLDADAATVERARDRVDVAVTSSAQLQDLRRRRAALEEEAEARHRDAEAALAARQGLLAASGTVLAEAVERERVEAERVALEQALAAAAQAAADRAAAAPPPRQAAARPRPPSWPP